MNPAPATVQSIGRPSLHLRLRWAYETAAPRDRIVPHRVVGTTIWHLLEGSAHVRASHQDHKMTAPCIAILAPGLRSHRFTPQSRLQSFNGTFRDDAGSVFGLAPFTVLPRMPSLERGLAAIVRHVAREAVGTSETERRLSELRLHALLAQMACHLAMALCRSGSQPFAGRISHPGLARFLQWFEQTPEALGASEETCARRAGLSTSQFKRILQRELRISFREFMLQRRLEYCQDALLSTREPLKRISSQAGFESASNFIRWFRQHCQITPSAYRRAGAAGV